MTAAGFPWNRTIADQQVAVAPTDTVVLAAFSTRRADGKLEGTTSLSISLNNLDLSQTLDAWFESSWDGSTKWATVNVISLDGIAVGETRYQNFVVKPWRYLRLMGRASGAGLNCRVAAELLGDSL